MSTQLYFVSREEQPEKWREIWQALTAILSGGETASEITDKDIGIFCAGYGYEGSDERGHCFTKREKSNKKHYIFIEALS